MSFKKGMAKVPGSGMKKGGQRLGKAIKIIEFVREHGINIPQLWLESILIIEDPEARAKAFEGYYRFIGRAPQTDDVETEPIDITETSIMDIIND